MYHYELQNIISGISNKKPGNLIQTVAHQLNSGKKQSVAIKKHKLSKQQEEEILTVIADTENLWVKNIDENSFLAEGAEQKVYLCTDGKNVLKLNDSIFYVSWLDYFLSLQLHNYFFPATNYKLIGFTKKEATLFAVVKQPYIEIDAATNLEHVKLFLENNGFMWKRNNDYFHPEYGIILEDLHDENVLTKSAILFFIDSVFYVQKNSS
jgi:hypothetical protein